MPETIDTPQAQPQVATSGLDRLSREFDEIFSETPTVTTAAEPVVTATQETEKLEDPTITDPVITETITEPITATEPVIEEPVGFSETTAAQEETEGWKPIIEALGYQVPADYTEEKGFEFLNQLKEQEIQSKLEEVKNYREAELFSEFPEDVRDEAKLTFELFKSGQTLEQINAPIQQIKEWKSMSKEELIRHNLEGIKGNTPEMVDHQMNKIIEGGHVDIEHQILMNYVNFKEAELIQQRQQQITQYSNQQSQIREAKRQTELNSFKAALDKVPTFMDRKLSDENKTSILNDFHNGYVQQLTSNPEKIVKFMLYDKYGPQGLEYLQARALEKATLEKAKSQLNIPPVTSGPANAVQTTTTSKNGMDRLSQDARYQ